jgi:spore coat protein JB
MTDRAKLMRQVQNHAFALNEAALYLDGHPDNEKAIAYYNRQRNLLRQAVCEYEMAFGPLMQNSEAATSGGRWTWVDGPWPWEGEN